MPAKAPCVEVAEAVEAQAKVVRMSRLIAELAAQASQTRDKKDAVKPDEQVADVADRGWRARATAMVRGVLKRLEEQRIAPGCGKNEIRAAAKAAVEAKVAASLRAEGRAGRCRSRSEGRGQAHRRRQDAAGFGEKDMQRSRPGREHGGCPRSTGRMQRAVDGK